MFDPFVLWQDEKGFFYCLWSVQVERVPPDIYALA